MKSSYVALAVVGLALAALWYAGGGSATLPSSAAAAEQVRVSEPLTHDNLTVFFVHGPDAVADAKVATLQEALESGWAVVHETGDVNQLAVENRSIDTELFIQEGDIIKGGRQDRLIAIDMLLPPNSGRVLFPAHCVEQGRWTGRGSEDSTRFKTSDNFVIGNGIKYANATRQQGEVWKNVKENQDKLSRSLGTKVNAAESESSLQLALENKAVQAKVAEYEKALKKAGESGKNIVGVVFVVNGKMTGAEVYGSSVLFQKAWPKLLSSAAAEALAEKTDKAHASAPSAKEVERFLACGGEQQATPNGTSISDDQRIADLVRRFGATEAEAREALRPMSVIRDGTSNGLLGNNGTGNMGVVVLRGMNPELVQQATGAIQQREITRTRTENPRVNTAWTGGLSGRSGATRTTFVSGGGAQPNMPPNANPGGGTADVIREVADLLEPAPRELNRAASPSLQPANPQGNRLNVNRVDGAGGLVTESRDPARQNAIVHKSYIKK